MDFAWFGLFDYDHNFILTDSSKLPFHKVVTQAFVHADWPEKLNWKLDDIKKLVDIVPETAHIQQLRYSKKK
jgi:hypothetical protein